MVQTIADIYIKLVIIGGLEEENQMTYVPDGESQSEITNSDADKNSRSDSKDYFLLFLWTISSIYLLLILHSMSVYLLGESNFLNYYWN